MIKKERIPTLKGDTYRKSYFKHGQPPSSLALSADRYFEINRRCLWPEVIDAHRLDFYMIFIVTRGEGIHTFGPKEYYIRQNSLCFVSPDMVSSWRAEVEEQQGYFVTFSEIFFNQGCENKRFLQEIPFFQLDGHAVLTLSEEQTQYYLTIFQFMYNEYHNGNSYSPDILRAQLHLILHKAHAQLKTETIFNDSGNHAGMRLVKGFKALYLRDFHSLGKGKGLLLKKVADYANELGVSQNHLNDTIKSITGRSAGQLIRQQLTSHATMCLMHADKSIGEIAFALGFEDPSYFARFYKSQTGKSPSEFRAANL
ncbi:MAG TPA: AraC family transcriptional regulator [Chryseolinea sp.]|jgi:AraC-like DNA-binding protein|nr:AraC family transcriptional regulator [Chryseolinea sp.]